MFVPACKPSHGKAEYDDGGFKASLGYVASLCQKKHKIKIKSKGFTGAMGACRSEIMVDNIDYSMNRTGINIVVIDKETGNVLDSIHVNTYSDPNLKINRA